MEAPQLVTLGPLTLMDRGIWQTSTKPFVLDAREEIVLYVTVLMQILILVLLGKLTKLPIK